LLARIPAWLEKRFPQITIVDQEFMFL